MTMQTGEVLAPTRIHLLWHAWALPTWDTGRLRRDTVWLLSEYLGWHYPHIPLVVSFDEELMRAVECHMDFDYEALLPSERETAQLFHKRELAALVGDVMRWFVAKDSFDRMKHSRGIRGADHERYGLGTGRDTIPFPPYRDRHMPRFPLEFDKTYDGSRIYDGPIGPGQNPLA